MKKQVSILTLAMLTAAPAFAEDVTMVERSEGQVRVAELSETLTMHTYLSKGLEGGIGSVNTHIFESEDGIIIFDTQFYKAAAEDVKAYVEELGKPVEKLIVSHAHPDHGFGYAYMSDLAPASGTEHVIEESKASFPMFSQMMVERMGEDAAKANLPVDNLPEITETLELGEFEFGGTNFEIFELPSHEVGHETFVQLPEFKMLMVFDSIMPNTHQLIFTPPNSNLENQVKIGQEMIDALAARDDVETLVFGHNSIEPLPADEQFQVARESLEIYLEAMPESENAEEFIANVTAAQPDWEAFYVPMTAGMLFPEESAE